MTSQPWKVSLHGGHSGKFCEHAEGELRAVLEAAVAAGYHTFGVSEHAPRRQERFLYPTEREKGYTVERLAEEFDAYAQAVAKLAEEFADRLVVLRGFEVEVVPASSYRDEMLEHRRRYGFEYMVGSVHYVDEIAIDGEPSEFERVLSEAGSLEALAIRYYQSVAEMVEALQPEVVGHLDLIRKNAPRAAVLNTPAIRDAAEQALDAIAKHNGILDLNTAGYRKGLGSPYPAPWLVRRAHERRIGFCFGDDSHGPDQVGAGLDEARQYLLDNGVGQVSILTREDGKLVRRQAAL